MSIPRARPMTETETAKPGARPCKGCPEHAAPDNPLGTSFIVYTGGPPHAPFANVIQALSNDQEGIVTKWSKPTVHPDGAIEYQQNEAKPPEIEGYQRDASNPRLLRPIWPHCAWRSLRVWRADDGSVKIAAVCLTPASEIPAYETLALAQCKKCQHLTD